MGISPELSPSFPFLSGWCRHKHWRLQLQLLPVLEGPPAWTWPFTARRCLWPFPSKTQRLLFWSHGDLNMKVQQLCSALVWHQMKMWCSSADGHIKSMLRLLEVHLGEMQQPDVSDCRGSPVRLVQAVVGKWASCWCKVSMTYWSNNEICTGTILHQNCGGISVNVWEGMLIQPINHPFYIIYSVHFLFRVSSCTTVLVYAGSLSLKICNDIS